MSTDPLLGDLLSDARTVVRRLMDEPPSTVDELSGELVRFEATVRAHATDLSRADWETGLSLVARARALLSRWEALDHRGRRRVQVAVRYLTMEDDGDRDLTSAFGFDDDEEVLDAVERALGERP